jgi:integrase
MYGTIVRLLILTGQRRGEITQLSPQMVGEDLVTLPNWLTKNGREHLLPVGPLAAAMLAAAASSNELDTRFYIFPAQGNPEACFDGFTKCKTRLDALSRVTGWRLHDLRRTFASGLASLGIAMPVTERLLNHVSGSFGGIVGVY